MQVSDRFDVIVVGAGFGGATCAALLARRGLRTLLVDMDPQGNATQHLLDEPYEEERKTLFDFYDQMLSFRIFSDPAEAFVHETVYEDLDILPAHPDLAELQPRLESRYKIYKFREMLSEIGPYEAVYIDTPPAMNFFTLSALIASGQFPWVCHGHTHRTRDERIGKVRVINPGALKSPRDPRHPTVAVLDTEADMLEFIELD